MRGCSGGMAGYRFSPSDLTELLGCRHSRRSPARPPAASARRRTRRRARTRDLVFAKGNEHEDDVPPSGCSPTAADHRGPARLGRATAAAARTAELMREGADVIYQGAFARRRLARHRRLPRAHRRAVGPRATGRTRRSTPSSRASRPSRRTRSSSASTARPSRASRAVRRASRTSSSARACARRCACASSRPTSGARAGAFEAGRRGRAPTEPYPVPALHVLRLPAGVRADAGGRRITSRWSRAPARPVRAPARRARLVATRARRSRPAADTGRGSCARPAVDALRQQARLQVEADEPSRAAVRAPAGRGAAAASRDCREPSPGDVFFDIEGHPYFTAASDLTFLFGLLLADGGGWRYEPIWAHDLARGGRGARARRRPRQRAAGRAPRHARLPLQPRRARRAAAADGAATRRARRRSTCCCAQGVLVDLY